MFEIIKLPTFATTVTTTTVDFTLAGSDLASDTRLRHNVDHFAYYGELGLDV